MNSRTASIEATDLLVHRGGRPILPSITLQVGTGVVTGLLGPSGSGKTTLMRAIVGVQVVAGGEVRVLGEPAGIPPLRNRIAYVTQAPSVYSDLTVRENLTYFARVVGAPVEKVDATIEEVGLNRQATQVVRTLSGGEQSRASLAAALLGEPEVLILDEPTVGLDPVLRRDLWVMFHALAETGTTMLVSTHVMDEAERCDQLILLREGNIVATGSPSELLERTSTSTLEDAFLSLATA